jgi:23S rRNA pseudouridine1911/1915/1917 synthase
VSDTIVTFQIGENPPARLDKAIARDVPEEAHLSRSRLMRLLAEGAVQVNGVVQTAARALLAEGDTIAITVDVVEQERTLPEDISLDILHEDADLIVVNKPVGMVVHPAPGTPGGTLVNALLHHFGGALSGVGGERRPGIVHRIDKDTSGLLVVAKSDAAHHGLAAQFERHTVHRKYLALCHGVPDPADPRLRGIKGTSFEPGNILKITTMLARHKTDRQRQAVLFTGGRHAVTRVRVLEDLGSVGFVECWLETGRTHQIRVHMSHAGHALIGDQTYGGRRKLPKDHKGLDTVQGFTRQALHAAELGFTHPLTDEALQFAAPLPADMELLLNVLR